MLKQYHLTEINTLKCAMYKYFSKTQTTPSTHILIHKDNHPV